MEREYLGIVRQIGYYLVAVAELTRTYGLRGWNGELAKVIQYVVACGNPVLHLILIHVRPQQFTSKDTKRLCLCSEGADRLAT